MKITFPDNFLWGSAISSYQAEGGNIHSDWHHWEKDHNLTPCAGACDHYRLYGDDIFIAKSLGHNAFRFSIEWGRIFPQKNSLDVSQLSHYHAVLTELTEHGILPFVTLHHFTNPAWFADEGGWESPHSVDYYLQYVRTVVSHFNKQVRYWITFNEPMVYLFNGYISGLWPPGKRAPRSARRALKNILRAHETAYREIKSFKAHADQPVQQVSIAKNMRVFSPCSYWNIGQNHLFSFLRSKLFNSFIIDYLAGKHLLDYIGLNYYCREFVRTGGLLGSECCASHHRGRRNALGWHIYPEGLYISLTKLRKYGLPVFVTENGTAQGNDGDYLRFMDTHLTSLACALRDGVDVRGYFWWSLLDNFEWDKGFSPRFGLIAVDYTTGGRTVRPFALRYKKVCEENSIILQED